MKTIKHKTFEVLSSNELRSFSTQELQRAIWIAQGNKTSFDIRTRQYGNNIKEWIHDGLMLHENKRSRDKLIEDRAIEHHLSKQQHINFVMEKDCIDAIKYLWYGGMTEQMRSEDRRYTEILIKRVANTLNHKLKLN